jgi:tetratricopeptide (TPR) repeat protein
VNPERASNELSGTVVGPSVQAGTIHGDVHLHDSPQRPPVPRQLLAPSPYFTNRSNELRQLDELLGRSALVVLSGPAGVGKTALATQWAHRVKAGFPDGQLYCDLGGFSEEPVDPGAALGGFLRALGVAAQHVPGELSERAALYRSVAVGRTLLVVLDNAFSVAQARVLIPPSPSSMTVVTSRSRLVGLVADGARLLDVPPLSQQDSVSLLARTVGTERIARERQSAETLARACGGLPIALSVAAARLAARPRLSVGRMASELADEAGRLVGLSAPEGPSLQAALDLSYRSLPSEVAALYRRLALHPGPDFGMGPVAALLAPEAHPPRAVDQLLEANLLLEIDEERFRFHDLLRLHARQKTETHDTPDQRRAAVGAMLDWYLAVAAAADTIVTPYRRRLPYTPATKPTRLPALTGRDEALDWLERERANLLAAGRAAYDHGYHELAWHLSDVVWPLFLYHAHDREQQEVDRRGVAAARRWGNAWAEADMLKRLGRSCRKVGEYDTAEQHLRAAIRRYEEIGDARGRLDAWDGLAALYRDSGREAEAVTLFRRVLAANRDHGDERSTGLSLINLGLLLPRLGRTGEAVDMLHEARELFAGLADVDPYNGVRVLHALAGAHLRAHDLDSAERYAAEAAEQMRELGSAYGQAEALDLLGQVAQGRGELVAARRRYEAAVRVFEGTNPARASQVRGRLTGVIQRMAGPPGVQQPHDRAQ